MIRKNIQLALLIILFSIRSFSQTSFEFSTELFEINLNENSLRVVDKNGEEIFLKDFIEPSAYTLDIDQDGVEELFVTEKISNSNSTEYILYIFNLLDNFYLAAEISSGIIEPYNISTGEIEGLIIVTGNSDFSYLNDGSELKSLPINCWKYEDGEIFPLNDELYEIFTIENENLLPRLDEETINNCEQTKEAKSLIASVYVNYLNAGENASAENFLETFYKCDDLNSFKDEINEILNEENDEI